MAGEVLVRPYPTSHGSRLTVYTIGNMANVNLTRMPSPKEYATPTLKADVYTTGRGGSGNMVANEDPVAARVSQDVGVPPNVAKGSADEGTFVVGRGECFSYGPLACADRCRRRGEYL